MPAQRSSRAATTASTCPGSATSAANDQALPPSASIEAATASISAAVRATSSTSAPSRAALRAVASPIPLPPPETRTRRLANRPGPRTGTAASTRMYQAFSIPSSRLRAIRQPALDSVPRLVTYSVTGFAWPISSGSSNQRERSPIRARLFQRRDFGSRSIRLPEAIETVVDRPSLVVVETALGKIATSRVDRAGGCSPEAPVRRQRLGDDVDVDQVVVVVAEIVLEQERPEVLEVLLVELDDLELREQELGQREGYRVDRETLADVDGVAHAELPDEHVDVAPVGLVVEHEARSSRHRVKALVGRVPEPGEQPGDVARSLAMRDEIEVGIPALEVSGASARPRASVPRHLRVAARRHRPSPPRRGS